MASLDQPTMSNVYSRDLEANLPFNNFTPSPARCIAKPPIDTPRSHGSVPHGSVPRRRCYAGSERRRLKSETYHPLRTSLDEDLGFPPICSPPPDEVSGSPLSPSSSAPPGRLFFRHRSKSEHIQNYSISSEVSPLVKKPSGLLVVFPHTNSAPSPQSPIGGVEFFASKPQSCSPSKSFESALPLSSPRDGNARSCPRRPLFVDTQLANGQKRSPVGSMIEFMRGRSRTNSVGFSGSISGPNTPCTPQPVSARASASADAATMPMSPLYSPGGRPMLSRNAYGYRNAYRSVDSDSGLCLSSPSIGHTALLIKERALFSSFDSMTIGSSLGGGDINTVFLDCQDAVYSLFFRAHKCYDLIPTSTKLVVFDTHLPVRKAFFALVYNGVRAAPLYDSDKGHYVGMLTITDFIKILIKHYEAGDSSEKMRALEEEEISHWRQQFAQDGCLRPLVSIDPSDSLHHAVQLLCESKVHRLPVLDRQTGNISYILTHKRLIKFLSLYMYDLPRPAFMEKTPRDLGIGSWGDILTIHVDTPLHDALEIFLKNRVSALPLVDKDGKVVDIYAKFDVISLAAEKSYDKLDCTVQEALTHRSDWFEGVQCCKETDSLFTVVEAIIRAEVHRLIVTDENKKVVGIISLSDILKYLILDPVLVDSQAASMNGEDSPIDGIPEDNED